MGGTSPSTPCDAACAGAGGRARPARLSRLRAAYLKNLLALEVASDGQVPDETAIADLKRRREAYEEALQGFGALRHAFKRGYLQLT